MQTNGHTRNTEMDGAHDRLHGGEPSFSSGGVYHLTLLALSSTA